MPWLVKEDTPRWNLRGQILEQSRWLIK